MKRGHCTKPDTRLRVLDEGVITFGLYRGYTGRKENGSYYFGLWVQDEGVIVLGLRDEEFSVQDLEG